MCDQRLVSFESEAKWDHRNHVNGKTITLFSHFFGRITELGKAQTKTMIILKM